MIEIVSGLFDRRGVSIVPDKAWRSTSLDENATGIQVTPDTAMRSMAVFASVRILAETTASLPLITYQRNGSAKERAQNHPLYSVLHDIANEEMTAFMLRETLMGHLVLRGNAFAEIERNRLGDVVGLWPLRPDKVRLDRGQDGKLVYVYELPEKFGSNQIGLPAERVFHIRGLSPNGLWGYNPIALARQAVGLSMATEQFGAAFFGNGARPGMVLKHPNKLSDDAHRRLQSSWEDRHQGLEKSHRVAILEEGMAVEQISIAPDDAQFLESRKFQVSEIARLFRIPPHMLADLEKATYSNVEHLGLEFVIYSLRPWLVRIEQEAHLRLLQPSERKQVFVEHLVDGLLRGDISSRYGAYAIGRQWGWLSTNDVREKENLNPVEDGDQYLVPLNMIPANQVGMNTGTDDEEKQAPPEEEEEENRRIYSGLGRDLDERRLTEQARKEARARRSANNRHRLMLSHTRMFRDVMTRILRREINDVGAEAKKQFGKRDYGQFSIWLEDFYRDHIAWIMQQMEALLFAFGASVAAEAHDEISEPPDLTQEDERFIRRYLEAYASRHAARSEGALRDAMAKARENGTDPLEALEEIFDDWREGRPAAEAQDEAVRFTGAISKAVYVAGGRELLRWMAFGESCPYCDALDGVVVGINEFFLAAGVDFQPEGADRPLHTSHNVGHAPAHGGCDCMVTAG